MSANNRKAFRAFLASATMLAGSAAIIAPAAAQTTTSTVRGRVMTSDGTAATQVQVTATNIDTNSKLTATTDARGAYVVAGIVPGTYRFTATANGETATQVVQVLVGQAATLDLTLAPESADAANAVDNTANDIVVVGNNLFETRTSEVATNITQEQIKRLPQTDRNFLSFAQLAPGVNYNDSETDKGIQSGASTASQVNVFIDGVSQKNQVLDGGIAGQENSRGNPFAQLGVQEFRVLTQNYKAEYEQAGAAIITAITKSGTNDFHGEGFFSYTGKKLSETSYFNKVRDLPKADFKRQQYGAALGGPIIKDKLFFFVTYEGNDQDRAQNVILGNRTPENIARFGQYEGSYVSPFREDLYFGKLTFTPNDVQRFDVSFNRRKETDIQGFGGQVARSAAENKNNTVDTYNFKWTYNDGETLNEFRASYLSYVYNPTSLNPDDPTYVYRGVITFGGKNSSQRIVQDSYTLRDDLTLNQFDGHTIKTGIKFAWQDYEFNKLFYVQPEFTYIDDDEQNQDFETPSEVRLGLGNPRIAASDFQFGAYIQDDWDVTDKLQLNLGLRWDYESNMYNNDYHTPPNAAAALRALPSTSYFNPEDYISTGNNRKPYLGMFQPRFGFSYDLNGDQSTVIFGGFGRYYDRNVFNNTLDEKFRGQYSVGTFYFSKDGAPTANGQPTVVWNDRYYNRDALLALRQTAVTGLPELFAVPDNAKPPVTDQFSLGVRQRFGIFEASITGSYIRGRHGYTNLFATRNPDGTCCDVSIPRQYGYSNVLIGYDGLDTRYKAVYLTLKKPYTQSSGWGIDFAYTLSKGEQNGNDLFSLDRPTPDAYGWRPRPGDQRHKLVLSGMVDLPYGFQFSTLSTFGSGQAFTVTDASQGNSFDQQRITAFYPPKNCISGVFAYCEVNISLAKEFTLFNTHHLKFQVDVFNVFNNKNFAGYGGYIGQGQTYAFDNSLQQVSNDDMVYLQPTYLLTLPRRLQLSVHYDF